MSITIPSHLSDADLDDALNQWRNDERRTTAQLVAHLAEFDARRLHLKAGFSSPFSYCTEVLGLSEHGTYNRIEAARAARRFPTILDGPSHAASRHVPAEVKRTVWERDGGTCAFVGQGGRRCNEPGWLELHHGKPFAAGGDTTSANLQLRCRAHNAYEARLFYGPMHADTPRGELGAGP